MTGGKSRPEGLGKAGRVLWDEIDAQVREDGLELDARERRWLRDACAEADQLARIETALSSAELEVRGSQGQPVPNGLLGEATRARTTIGALLARIGLVDPVAAEGKGRGSLTTSHSARAAALTRHTGSRSGVA